MSSALNYDRAKRRARGGQADPELWLPSRRSLRGWRVDYPVIFPVTVTRMATPKQADSKVLSKVLYLDEGQETAP